MAQKLSHVLKKSGITALYTDGSFLSQFTVQYVSTELGLTIQTYDPADITTLTDTMRNAPVDDVYLIAGNADSLQDIMNELNSASVAPVYKASNNDLFVLTQYNNYTFRVMNLQYYPPLFRVY